jgi:hypothetical protein
MAVHSAVLQQPSMGMQASPHRRWVPTQLKAHTPPSQVAVAFGGAGHGWHNRPQVLTLLSLAHMPLQSWVPLAHWPVQVRSGGTQAFWQSRLSPRHSPPQLTPSQVARPLSGGVQAEQETPQVAISVLLTHREPHRCRPDGQEYSHRFEPLQAAMPPSGTAVHSALPQHPSVAMHASPQGLKPIAQVFPQRWPSQVAMPLVGAGQGVHEGPQAFTLSLATQAVPHWRIPVPQVMGGASGCGGTSGGAASGVAPSGAGGASPG